MAPVPAQEGHRLRRDLDRARCLVLHRSEYRGRSWLRELALEGDAGSGEVEILPREPTELGLAHPGIEGEAVEGRRLRAGGLGGRQEGLRLVGLPAVHQHILVALLRVWLPD